MALSHGKRSKTIPTRPSTRSSIGRSSETSSSSLPATAAAATGSTTTLPSADETDGEGIAGRSDSTSPDDLSAELDYNASTAMDSNAFDLEAAVFARYPIAALLGDNGGGLLRPVILRRVSSPNDASSALGSTSTSQMRGDLTALSDGRQTIRAVFQSVADGGDVSQDEVDGAVATTLAPADLATLAASGPRTEQPFVPASSTSPVLPMASMSASTQPSLPPPGSLVQLDAFELEHRQVGLSTSSGGDDLLLVVRSWSTIGPQLTTAGDKQICLDKASSSTFFGLSPSPRSSTDTDGISLPDSQLASASELQLGPSLALRSAPSPRLPLELQAMILKETLALYRADDRRAREADKARVASAGRGASASSSSTGAEAGASRWSLLLVCRDWHALTEPELYKSVSLGSARSYDLLGRALKPADNNAAENERTGHLRSWIKRAVLRNVPSGSWRDPRSSWGRVLAGLQDLDSLKVRFADSAEGRLAGMPVHRSAGSIQAYVALMPETEGGDEAAVEVQNGQADGASAVFQTEPSVWATYPNLNPRIYHQHHLSTIVLPAVARAWPRFRVTSSELVFCLTHPPPTSAVLHLPLKSHHVTVFLAGDIDRTDRFARFLSRLAHGPALGDLRCSIRCPTEHAALAVSRALDDRPGLGVRLRAKTSWRIEVGWPVPGERHTWITRQFKPSGTAPTTTTAAGGPAALTEETAVPAWASQHGGLVLGSDDGGLGVAALPLALAADEGVGPEGVGLVEVNA